MVISQKYEVIDPESGMLDRSVFTDEAVYQEELEKIFGRAWLFIGHESLIPNPNDFFLTYMGEDPVILCRTAGGEVRAYLNMCRHRGNRIVRADDGNAKNFMCAYHGWTYSNEGKLVSVPGLQEAYYGELEVEALGLVEVAQLDSYAGLVFATWAEDAPSLEAYLGDMRWYMDVRYNHRDEGTEWYGPVKWFMPCNWKAPCDNAIGDNHHGLITHASSAIVQAQFKGAKSRTYLSHRDRFLQPGRQVSAGNGHGLLVTITEEDRERTEERGLQDWERTRSLRERYEESRQSEAERRLGAFRARRVRPGNSNIFPNLFLGGALALPRGPRLTEVWSWVQVDKDAPDSLKREMVLHHPQASASHLSSIHAQDDMNNWQQVTESGCYTVARHLPHDLSMGRRHDTKTSKYPSIRHSQTFCAETNQRTYYARWQEFMNAGSWADIHIDPITAQFEGTATLRG